MQDPSRFPVEGSTIVPSHEAENFLAELDIPIDVVRNAIKNANRAAMAKSSSVYPRTAKGLVRWLETVGNLRGGLTDYNHDVWSLSDPNNRPILINNRRSIELGVVGGNASTGSNDPSAKPQVSRSKGPETQQAVSSNKQLALFTVSTELSQTLQTWFLLYHVGPNGIKCELSLPEGMENGFFTGWLTRVLIDIEDFEMDTQYEEGGEDVDFRIS